MRMYTYPIFFLIPLCLFSICLHAQESLIRTYTVGDGLVMNRVRGFYQDQDGFIWMNTWDGISRYEGYRFRNYRAGHQLKHGFVNDIIEFSKGKFYLPLNDGSLAVMHNLEVNPEILSTGGFINKFYAGSDSILYACTDHEGICRFEHGRLVPLADTFAVKTVLEFVLFKDHFFFIGPYQGPSGVYDRSMKLVATWTGPPAYFNSIYKDHRDRIFVSTIEGLKEVDLTSPSFALKDSPAIPSNAPWKRWTVNSVIVTPQNDIWIGTNQGLVHLRPDMTWKVMTVRDGFLSNQISSLFLDRSNTLWIGTDAGAASINLQTIITDNRQLPGVFSNFLLPMGDGSVYVITGNSYINHVNSELNIIQSDSLGSREYQLLALYPGEDSILLIKQNILEEIHHRRYPTSKLNIENPGKLYTKSGNRLWVTANTGFICAKVPGPFQRVPDSGYFATCITKRNDQLIIGTLESGLFVAKPMDEHSCKLEIIRDLSMWTDDPRIRSMMTARNGDLWIGTRYKGLVRLSCNEDFTDCSKQSISIADGLVSNWITSMEEDQSGNIWVGSSSGIDKLIKKENGYYVFAFSRIHGYYVNVQHLILDPDGSLWVGHNEGLARIIDGRIDTIGPPATFITEVSLGGNEYSTFQASPVRLRYTQNSAHFAFSSPEYFNSSQLLFTYRLIGSKDTAWSKPVSTHEIFYGNLTPGKFRFEVATFGWNGERSTPVSYSFTISRPFWKQTWFLLLSLFVVGMTIIGLYRFRISQIQKVQSVRDRIAADLHDEIGSSLTHINILSEIGKRQHQHNHGEPGLFERIGSEVQSSAEALDDIIWSVKTRRDAIGDVIGRMRQYAAEIFEPAGITFQFTENVEGIQSLEMEFKRDFYLIYKEVLRNVLKHSAAGHVTINIQVDRSRMSMHISDDGKGFNLDTPTDRSGLSNIRSRAEKWDGVANWNSIPGKGTEVNIQMRPA